MSRKDDLEQAIAESYDLIHQYQAIIRESESPKAKSRARREIVEQRKLIDEYQAELRALNEKDRVALDALTEDDEPHEAVQSKPPLEARDATSSIRVLISYSHDSPEHTSRVLALSNRLRGDGIDCQIDQYEISPPEGWPRWMERQLREADYVLVVCTETYLRRATGDETPGRGRGARWESTLLYQHFYDADSYNARFIPIFWNRKDEPHIPIPLRGATYYCLEDDEGYLNLYRHLTDQPEVTRPELGTVRSLGKAQTRDTQTESPQVGPRLQVDVAPDPPPDVYGRLEQRPRTPARPLLPPTTQPRPPWMWVVGSVLALVVLGGSFLGIRAALRSQLVPAGTPASTSTAALTQARVSTIVAQATPVHTPLPAATHTTVPTATATKTPTATVSPTPTHTPTPSPTNTSTAFLTEMSTPVVTLRALLEAGPSVNQIVWSEDGRLLAIATYHIYIYDAHTLERIYVIDSLQWVDSIAFSPDSTLLASASYDGVTLWDTEGWGALDTFAGSKETNSVAFAPDGRLLATGSGSTIKLWDAASGSEMRTIPVGSDVRAVAFSPDGQMLAAGGGIAGQDLVLWDVESGEVVHTFSGHTNWIMSVAFSPDGQLLASASVDETARLWDLASLRQHRPLIGHTSQVYSVAFSPDGHLLASASWDLTVKLWDTVNGKELCSLTGHTDWVSSVAFSTDGTMLASGAFEDTVRIWEIAPGPDD